MLRAIEPDTIIRAKFGTAEQFILRGTYVQMIEMLCSPAHLEALAYACHTMNRENLRGLQGMHYGTQFQVDVELTGGAYPLDRAA